MKMSGKVIMFIILILFVILGEKVGEYVCLRRVHLLMNFMEHLDKLLYNAYEGCAVAMPAVHKVGFSSFGLCGQANVRCTSSRL